MIHSAGKALAAHYLGDESILRSGRLSLSPFRHVDFMGLIVGISTLSFGWGKPLDVVWQKFKKPLKSLGFISLAGVLANLLFAFAMALPLKWIPVDSVGFLSYIRTFLGFFFSLNISWAIFNLLPLPPGSGGGVLALFWPENKRADYFNFLEKLQKVSLAIILFDAILLRYAIGESFLFTLISFLQDFVGLFILFGS